MYYFGRACAVLDSISCKICVITTAVMVVITAVNIFTRAIFGFSIAWSSELARYMFVWSTLLGGAIVVNRSQLARTSIFVDKLPVRGQKVLNAVVELIVLVFSGYSVIYGYFMCLSVKEQASAALHISMLYVYLSVPVCFALIIVYTIYKLGLLFNTDKRGEKGGEAA